jgi:hypothetical protein
MKTLADLTGTSGLPVDAHLVLDLVIPINDGLQAQGDLLVVPLADLAGQVSVPATARWREVPPEGVELLRGGTGKPGPRSSALRPAQAAGGNAHTLVADPGTCVWTGTVTDPTGLAIGVFEAMAPAYLLHREHGGTGIAPGSYVVRRQREQAPVEPVTARSALGVAHRETPRGVEAARLARPAVRFVCD